MAWFLPYWKLDYKGKFKRSVFITIFAIVFTILFWKDSPRIMQWVVSVGIIWAVAQTAYTFIKWKREEKNKEQNT